MQPLLVHAPVADLALRLTERLEGFGAVAENRPGDGWTVVVPLERADRDLVPACLAATRDALAEVGLAATSVELDGHTHLIRSAPVVAAANRSS